MRGEERFGTTTQRSISRHDPRDSGREETHLVAGTFDLSAQMMKRGVSSGSVGIPRFLTTSALMRERSAPESNKVSMFLPVVTRVYTKDRVMDEKGWCMSLAET